MSFFPMPSGAYGESFSLTRTSLGLTTWRGSRAMILMPEADSRRWSFKESEVRLPIILNINQVHGHDIVSTINGIHTFDGSAPVVKSDHVFEVKGVSGSGTEFWVGMRRAVARMHRHNGAIEVLSRRDGLSFDVVSIAQERADELWLASLSGRVVRLTFDATQTLADANLVEFDQDSGLPKGKIKLETIAGKVRFCTACWFHGFRFGSILAESGFAGFRDRFRAGIRENRH
ncbi:MAG: hypothetical protein IPK97_19725 [Ahniella sp.]|nr:hypothetical protein [Ahniella sp.]